MQKQIETAGYYRLDTVATLSGLSKGRVRTYLRSGFVRPARVDGRQMLFGNAEIAQLRRIRRLADDLGLNLAGIDVTLNLLEQISQLQNELAERRAFESRLQAEPERRSQ